MRCPPSYESNTVKEFRGTHLIAQSRLRTHGFEFHRHYIAAVACSPSRTSLYTGQRPSLRNRRAAPAEAAAPERAAAG
jgi:choline-sulfatase